MTDLFTPAMPLELQSSLSDVRESVRQAADGFNVWLRGFLEETWAECHQVHTVQHGEKTLTIPGTPDFNAFDREFNKVKQAVGKLRWALWDIHSASPSPKEAERLSTVTKTYEKEAER